MNGWSSLSFEGEILSDLWSWVGVVGPGFIPPNLLLPLLLIFTVFDFMPGSAGGFWVSTIFVYFCFYFVYFCSDFGMLLLWDLLLLGKLRWLGMSRLVQWWRILTTFFLFLTARVWADIVMMKLSSLLSHIFFASSKFYQKGCVFCQS